jgi:hypothetical protein
MTALQLAHRLASAGVPGFASRLSAHLAAS